MNFKTTYVMFGTLVALLVAAAVSMLVGTKPGTEGLLLANWKAADIASKDVTKANNAPEIMPGRISGITTLKNTVCAGAPQDAPARISVRSKPVKVAVTVMTTNGVARSSTRPASTWARPSPCFTRYVAS